MERITLTRGLITRVEVGFPRGCCGLVRVQVHDKGWQIVPWTPGESLAWDGYVYQHDMQYPMVAEPYEVTVRTWSEDDVYTHRIYVGICMIEGDVDDSLMRVLKMLRQYA